MDFFAMNLTPQQANEINMLALAHVGDAAYELMVRTMLCANGHFPVSELHKKTVSRVNAAAQATSAEKILPALTEDELRIYKRGRNTKVHSVPHNAEVSQYHAATGLEALLGWLYLQGKTQRLNQLFSLMTEE